MSIDFSSLGSASPSSEATEPRRIFVALPRKSPEYAYPRDVQAEVWEQWHSRRDESDLLLRMNTGSGKTVVGLLILKSCQNEDISPCVYVVADNYLLEQVRQDANELGLSVTDDPNSPQFRSGRSILIANIHRLVNGRSVFGTSATGIKIKVGSLLVDDVHACVARMEEQFTLRIPCHHDAYEELLAHLSDALEQQSLARYQAIRDDDATHVMQVPFWTWADNERTIFETLHSHRDSAEFLFTWPLISEHLRLCQVGVSARQIEIGLPFPASDSIPAIGSAERRIYMTATFPDISVLATHFSANPATVSRPITPRTASDIGDRMILIPQETHPQTTESEIRDLLVEFGRSFNVVVIVPSYRRASIWEQFGAQVFDKRTIGAGVEALKQGHVGVVVLVNKYDGIDLPDDACRILVIDGLPDSSGELERLEELALSDTRLVLSKQVQRIEQGMGRGIRSNEDSCVVLLMGWRLTERLFTRGALDMFSPATRSQLELSQSLADQLRKHPISELSKVITQCLRRDQDWVSASRSARDGLTFDQSQPVSELALALRTAQTHATIGDYQEAVDSIRSQINDTGGEKLRGWLKFMASLYLHHADPVDAQKLLRSASADNRAIIRPNYGLTYRRLAAYKNQAVRCGEFLASTYADPSRALLRITSFVEDLTPDPETTEEFEEAWHQIGLHLGFASERPERDLESGPDVLWLTGNEQAMIVECKSGVVTDRISKRDTAQLGHSVEWFLERYDSSTLSPVGVLIHKSNRLNHDASAREGTRVITFQKVVSLREHVLRFAQTICTADKWQDSESIGERLLHYRLTAGQFLANWAIPTKRTFLPKK